MKKKTIFLILLTIMCFLVLLVGFVKKANSLETIDVVSIDDIVEYEGGTAEFKKIDPLFDSYNINRHSDVIDTTGTIDEVLVLGTESSNTVFTFKTHLNRDLLTKYFNILEWFIVPTKVQPYSGPNWGAEYADSDFESFEVTIKDANNPEKYVIFKTSNRPDSSTYCTYVSGRAGANGQSVEGVHTSDIDSINKTWGTALKASHVGSFPYDSVPAGFDYTLPLCGFLSLDYDTKQVFSVTGADKGKRVMVKDLDDGRYMIGTDVPWDGFDSKELEVSIRFLNIVSGRTAQVAIVGFNGLELTKGHVIDTKEPDVTESTILDERVLYGEVFKAMPITKCYAYDNLDGYIDDIEYKVYYNYGETSQKEYEIVDDRFTPDKEGKFYIVASATDRFGNTGSHIREVEIRKAISDLHIDLLENFKDDPKVGEKIKIPSALVYGGSVNKKYEVKVLFNDTVIETTQDGYFIPLKQGLYIIRYIVSDFYDVPKYFNYTLVVHIDDKPICYFPDIDSVVETSVKLNIPEFSAIDYSSFGDAVEARVNYYIKEPSSSEYTLITKDYTPTKEGLHYLKITASSVLDTEKSVSKVYEIYAKNCRFIRDYFITDNVTITEDEGDMSFVFNKFGASFYFLNPVLNKMFELDFSAKNESEFAPKMTITLTDSENKNKTITLLIEKNNDDSSTITQLGNSALIGGAISSKSTPFSILYSNGWIYDENNAVLKLSNYDNGDEFDYFASGMVYVRVEMGESTNDTTVSFSKFCGNQDFSYNADDITEPSIIYSDLGRVYMVGDEVSFTYDSFDLFDRNCTITVKVEHNGKVLSTGKDNKCSFVITEFGKFTITLKAVDKTGNETSLSFNVYCYDSVAPTISMTDIVPKTFKVNETVALPQATVTDNIDKNLSYSIYARRSTGSFVIITDELFTPDVKGKWTIYYYASDSCGNYTLTSFDVIVS